MEKTKTLTMMDYPREVYEQRMFFPFLTMREEAELKIQQDFQGKGTYLLRPSSSGDYNYFSLSISESKSQIHHVKINVEYQTTAPPKYYVASTVKFSSVTQLLDFYSQCEIHVQENIKDLKLLHPLIYQTPEIIRKDSLNSQREEHQLSGGRGNFDPSGTGRTPTPVYLELQGEPNQYLQTEPPSQKTISAEKQPIKTSISVKVKEKAKPGIKTRIFSKIRSKSVSQPPVAPIVKPNVKTTRSYSQLNPSDVPLSLHDRRHHCRPPAPLPPQNVPKSDDIIYSFVDPHRDFFQETYKFLKESEICECGLRLTDSELPGGWAVHFSKDEPTVDFVFFQREDITTWDIPEEILPSLSKQQLSFILKLCHKRPCPIPPSLTQFIKSEFMKNNSMSTSPVQAPPVRKGSLSSSLSAVSLSSSPSTGSKLFEYKAERKDSTGMQTMDEKVRFMKADELPDSGDQSEMADDMLDDSGCYEKAEKLFETNSAEGSETDVTAIPQETELHLILGKPQPAVRRSVRTQSSCRDSHPYVMEDVEADDNSDSSQQDQKRSRASSLTSSSKSSSSKTSSSLSDCTRPSSKQVTFEVPLKGIVLDETNEIERKSDALTYSFKTLSASGKISSQDAVLPPGPVELIAVASPSTQLTQHQLFQLQRQSQVAPSQVASPSTRLTQHQLLQLQQQSQVPPSQRPQFVSSSTQLTQPQLLQLQQQSQVLPSQLPQVPERASCLYQLNDTQHRTHDTTPQLSSQVGVEQQYHLQPVHLQQGIPSTLQPVQIITGPNLQHLSGQGQIFVELQEQQPVRGGDQLSQNSGQTVLQESLPFRGQSQSRQSVPGCRKHPLKTQQRPASVDDSQIFYVVRDKPN